MFKLFYIRLFVIYNTLSAFNGCRPLIIQVIKSTGVKMAPEKIKLRNIYAFNPDINDGGSLFYGCYQCQCC